MNGLWISVRSVLHNHSCPGIGSVKGIIDLFKKILTGCGYKIFGLRCVCVCVGGGGGRG